MNPDELGEDLTAQVNVKMPKALKDGLRKIYKKHNIPPTDLLRALGRAAVDYFEKHKTFTLPARVEPIGETVEFDGKEMPVGDAVRQLRDMMAAIRRDERWLAAELHEPGSTAEERDKHVRRQLTKYPSRRSKKAS